MNKSIRKVPEIRFKGFSEDWKQRELGELAEIVRGASPRPIHDPKWFDQNSDIGWLRISDVTEQNGRINYLEQKISKAGQEKTRVLYEPHLLLSIAATVGKPVINYIKTGVHDGFLIFMNPNFYQEFMFQWLEMYRPNWQKYGQPGSQINLNSELVRNQVIKIPSFEEQTRISNIFKELDKTITLHKRKIALLKQLKQGYLQDMFPQKEESVPKIRFANLDSVWVQHKLGEVIDSQYNGQTPSRLNDEFWDGDINWLSSGELNRAVVFKTIEKITEDGKNNANLKVVPKGTFVMAITGLEAAGTRGNCAKLGIDTTLNQSCMALFPNKKVLNDAFLFQWYRKVGEKYGIRYTQGTKQQSYNAKLLEILPIILPNIKEQTLISNFLDKLDETIALHQAKLEKLQSLKKAYLQKMFI